MTGYRHSDLVNWNIDLDQFDRSDWEYDSHFDVYFIRENSKLYSWCALKSSDDMWVFLNHPLGVAQVKI